MHQGAPGGFFPGERSWEGVMMDGQDLERKEEREKESGKA